MSDETKPAITWIEGPPPELLVGMLVVKRDGLPPWLVGDLNDKGGLCECCSYNLRAYVRYSTSLCALVTAAQGGAS